MGRAGMRGDVRADGWDGAGMRGDAHADGWDGAGMCTQTVGTARGCVGIVGMHTDGSSCVLSRGKSVDVRAGVSTLGG